MATLLLPELRRLNDRVAGQGARLAVRAYRNVAKVGGPAEQKRALLLVLPDMLDPVALAMSEGTRQIYLAQPGGVEGFEAQVLDGPARALTPGRVEVLFDWAWTQADSVAAFQAGIDRWLRNVSRETTIANAAAEGGRWARHASANACGFCRMLATRGAVYTSDAAAGRVVGSGKEMSLADRRDRAAGRSRSTVSGRGGRFIAGGRRPRGSRDLGARFHDHCHCQVVAVRPGESYVEPPYVEQWRKDYHAAVEATREAGRPAGTGWLIRR